MARAQLPNLKDLPQAVAAVLADLPPKQQRFVAAYCGEARGNSSLAARLAGYTAASAGFHGYSLLKIPQVRKAVDAWMAAYAMSAAELTARIADLAVVHPGPFTKVVMETVTTGKGKQKKTTQIPVLKYVMTEETWERYQHWVRAIEVDARTGAITKLHLHDAQRAQATLAKILKLYSDQPILTLNLYLQNLSDEGLLDELMKARAAVTNGGSLSTTPSPN